MRRNKSLAQSQTNASQKVSRRTALKAGALGGVALMGFPAIVRARGLNDKLNIAVVGCGNRGAANLSEVAGENIVALCDVNENNIGPAAQAHPQARKFTDFREMYEKLSDSEFDAVVVSTTEHTHAFATLPALKRKKHVYCEKPLTHNVQEARLIIEAAKEAGVATQMGTQIHAGSNFRRVVELVKSGALGQIEQAHVWVSRAWGRQTPEEAAAHGDIVNCQERPLETQLPPSGLDWNLWLGPAPARPFNDVYFPGPKWYRWWAFGNGTMSDLGSHFNDLPFWALDLDAPLTIEAAGPPPHAEIAPASMRATYTYGPRGDRAGLTLTWYQGTEKPEPLSAGKIPAWGDGMLFQGTKAWLLSDYSKNVVLVDGKPVEDFARPAPSIPDSIGHHQEWIRACKTGEPTTCAFSYSGPLTEANHLGNVAYRAGKKLEWDAVNLKIPNCPEAEQFLGREYRPGWTLT